jgi:hypothetical protein
MKINGIKTGKTVFFTVAAVTITNNFLIAVTTSVANRNNTIRYLKHDDEVDEVYKITKKLPLTKAYSL